MIVLPDTSIWVDYFRDHEPASGHVEVLVQEGALAICGPILAELVAGADAPQRNEVRVALSTLPYVDLGRDEWRQAGELSHELRRRGQVVPLMDVLIAVAATRSEAALWTRDRDFARIAEVAPALTLYDAG